MPDIQPPRFLLAFFRWFCHPDFMEDIEGDLMEQFHKRVESLGLRKAQWLFAKDVLLLFRPGIIRNIKLYHHQNHLAMFKNYLTIAFRIIKKEKGYTFINILGLALGIACSLFICLWLQDELKHNNFFTDSDRVCFVMSNEKMSDGQINTYHASPYNLVKVLRDHYPSIQQVAIASWGNWTAFEKDGTLMEKKGIDASPELLEMLKIDFIKGTHAPLYEKLYTIVISESFANSLYGDKWKTSNVIGEMIVNEAGESFELAGIYKDLPVHSTIRFEFAIPFELRLSKLTGLREWDYNASQVFVKLADHVSLEDAQKNIAHAVIEHSDMEDSTREIFLQPFNEIYLYNRFENGKVAGGRIEYIKILSVAAILILLLAAINFTNLSTARSSKRVRETGLRKVMGSVGVSLRLQFITESILITALGMIAALIMVYLLLPVFNNITGKEITADFISLKTIPYLAGFVLLLGLIAGIYPAFYLSSAKIISSLKGTWKHSKGDVLFRKSLVVFQFMITIIMITASITLYRQVSYIQSKNIGLERSNLIQTWAHAISSSEDYGVFKSELLKRPGIENVTMTNQNPMDIDQSTSGVKWAGKPDDDQVEFYVMSANPDFIPTAGMKLKEGRNFDWNIGADTVNFIINEAAQKLMGLRNPVGEDLELWGQKGKIVGIVHDFHTHSLHSPIEPLVIRFNEDNNWLILARTTPGKTKEALTSLEDVYHMFNSKREFGYKFMDDVYDEYYKSEYMVKDISLYFTILGIVISCLGLFALVSYTAEKRTREICIRKILGATISNIIQLLSGEFVLLLTISLVIAIPLAWYILSGWLSNFAYHIELNWWIFTLAGIVAMIISYAIIGGHALRSAFANPAKNLRNE